MVTQKKDRNESNCLWKDVNVNETKVNGNQIKKIKTKVIVYKKDVNVNKTKVNSYQKKDRNESNCL